MDNKNLIGGGISYLSRNGINVLSLFDGISCGFLALERAGISVNRYVAYEIDKYAIEISKKNFPNIEHKGTVVGADFTQFKGFDLLIGGSPCQGFSFAGKQLNFDDPRSKLFFEFVRALEEVKPKYFLFENVKMKKEYEDVISQYLGVKPILINSNLVSAQNRKRLYWTNIPGVTQPQDKGIILQDILDTGIAERNKSYCIDASYYKGGNPKSYFIKHRRTQVFETSPEHNSKKVVIKNGILQIDKNSINVNLPDGIYYSRNLSVNEVSRLQTIPDNYCDCVSKTNAYKCLGNGWTVDVIAHILSSINL